LQYRGWRPVWLFWSGQHSLTLSNDRSMIFTRRRMADMDDKLRLDGKIALVTGAAGGLGEHFSRMLGAAGAKVVVVGRRLQPLEDLAAQLREENIQATALSLDVTDPASVKAGFDKAQQAFGLVNVVVSNAGAATDKPALQLSTEEWSQVVDINLKGSWVVCAEAARRLVDAGQPGSLINVTSILGYRVAGSVLP